MNSTELRKQQLAVSVETITNFKRNLETEMITQISNMANGNFEDNIVPMKMENFQKKMRVLNRILAIVEGGVDCLNTLYIECKECIEDLYTEVKNGNDLRYLEGITVLRNLVVEYGIEVGFDYRSMNELTACKPYYFAILDVGYIDYIICNLKDCRAELIELSEMAADRKISDIPALQTVFEEDIKGYLHCCNIAIKALEERKPDDLIEHEKALEHFLDDMKEMFKGTPNIIEACKFVVKIYMKEKRVSDILSNYLSFFIRDLKSKEDVVEYVEETATRIKDALVYDWEVETEEELKEKREELEDLFFVLDYLKALLI